MDTIALSGKPNVGKTSVAKAVAEALGFGYFSAGSLWREQYEKDKMDMPFHQYFRITSTASNVAIERQQLALAKKGKIVIDSRFIGLACRLGKIPAYKIYLTASLESLLKRAKEKNGDGSVTEEIINQRENDELDKCIAIYKRDFRQKDIYDLYLDTTELSKKEVVNIIIEAVKPKLANSPSYI